MSVDILKLRQLLAEATALPWTPVCSPWGNGTHAVSNGPDPHGRPFVFDCDPIGHRGDEEDAVDPADDAKLICEAVNMLPYLLDAADALRTLATACAFHTVSGAAAHLASIEHQALRRAWLRALQAIGMTEAQAADAARGLRKSEIQRQR